MIPERVEIHTLSFAMDWFQQERWEDFSESIGKWKWNVVLKIDTKYMHLF